MNIQAMQQVSLEIAGNNSVQNVLDEIVRGIAVCQNVALCRIWLISAGERAGRDDGEGQWLQLAAGSGNLRDPATDPARLDGRYARFALGDRKIGRVAASGEGVRIQRRNPGDGAMQFADPRWIEDEGIESFAAQPLIARGETLGVIAVFDRLEMTDEDFAWLRTFADHAAVAITSARALGEIERLKARLELENDYLRTEVTEAFGPILGGSPALQKVLRQIEMVAPTDATVLVLGESGVGKELVAREIHDRSARAARPLIKVNCASIPGELFESEFFGHVRGSFTGAVRDRAGRFELADGGTLFLDEVGEIPIVHQARLLRVLQESAFERIGEERTREVDVRIIAATNRDLTTEVAEGRFRADLYYRLSVFPIEVPPLRERPDDIVPLAIDFLARSAKSLKVDAPRLTQAHSRQLNAYDWPGNVRELQHVVERAVILSRGGRLRFAGLEPSRAPREVSPEVGHAGDAEARSAAREDALPTLAELKDRERAVLRAAMTRAGGKISGPGGAAELLDVKPSTLDSKLKAFGLKGIRARHLG